MPDDKEVAARYLMRQVAPVMDRKQVAIAQEIYLRCADSVQYLTQTESVARMHSLYNYGLRERESARMQQAYTNQTKNLLILSCCLIGCLLARFYPLSGIPAAKSSDLGGLFEEMETMER